MQGCMTMSTIENYSIQTDNSTIKVNSSGQIYIASVPPVDIAVTAPITNTGNTLGLAFDNATLVLNGSNQLVLNLNNANTWTALQTIKPSTSITPIALLGEQTTSSTAMVNIIYTSTDAAGLVAGTYPFIQATAGTDTFIGVLAGNSNTGTAAQFNSNVGIGYQVLFKSTTGGYNVAVGNYAMYYNTGGGSNVAIGYEALLSNTTGYANVAVGEYALLDNTTGYENVAVGVQALVDNTTGYANVAVGEYALDDNTTGSQNTAIGARALILFNNTTSTAGNIVAIGYSAASNYTGSETNDIVIGNVAGIAGESNAVRIGTSIQLGTSTQTTLTGTTAGSIVWSQPFQSGSYKKFIGYASGYENTTATAQTITYPTAFTETPMILGNSTGMTLSTSTSALTLPASMSASATGWIIIEGY